jgi:DNA-binding MarR family transcriptional regulator
MFMPSSPKKPWTKKQLEGFQAAAQSLKLYRRAELLDKASQSTIVKLLYVDPLPHDHVFETVMRPHTTFLIGRKGTGKSTVFQRAQYELRHQRHFISAYVDIKTTFEEASTDPSIASRLSELPDAMSTAEVERLLLYRAFIRGVIGEIKKQLQKRLEESFWEKFKNTLSGSMDELFEGLDELLEESETKDRFVSVLGLKTVETKEVDHSQHAIKNSVQLGGKVSKSAEASGSISATESVNRKIGGELKYGDILVRVFNVKEIITKLKTLLSQFGIKHLYVFVDDFSELPEDAMAIVVDTLLAPLNNWSDELIKFKVAAYPGRIYYGAIDKAKIDEQNLDLYSLYGTTNVSDMEEKCIDFTKRLLQTRLSHYCECEIDKFAATDETDFWSTIFYATNGNPRNLGYLLYYLYESHLIFGRRLGIRAIKDAARRYYEEKIAPYFILSKFQQASFHERSSAYSLKELFEKIVGRARELRRKRDSEIMEEISHGGAPPTSHFHVLLTMESLLSTLELNFFVTKYYEMSDRSGRKVGVFALNYGLCQKFYIEYGRPKGQREYRLYLVERAFDFTPLLQQYLRENQEIKCSNCGELFDLEQLEALRLYGMRCPKCGTGSCVVTNLSTKYDQMLRKVDEQLLLPSTELGILQALESEKRPMNASEIAGELDRSYQLVGKRGKMLEEKGLVNRSTKKGRRIFEITLAAEGSYFTADASDELDIDQD